MYADAMAYCDISDNLKLIANALMRKQTRIPQRILVGVDGSPSSLAAVGHARELAAEGGGQVQLVNVQPSPADSDARRAGERLLAGACALFLGSGVAYSADVAFGEVAESLLRYAAQTSCTKIILGNRKSGVVARLMRRGVADRVIARATVPVYVVVRAIRATIYTPQAAPRPSADDRAAGLAQELSRVATA